jgi:hypothetical protein
VPDFGNGIAAALNGFNAPGQGIFTRDPTGAITMNTALKYETNKLMVPRFTPLTTAGASSLLNFWARAPYAQSSSIITTTATTINVESTLGFPSSGIARIDDEEFSYTGLTATSFTGVTRGIRGTTAATHNNWFACQDSAHNTPATCNADARCTWGVAPQPTQCLSSGRWPVSQIFTLDRTATSLGIVRRAPSEAVLTGTYLTSVVSPCQAGGSTPCQSADYSGVGPEVRVLDKAPVDFSNPATVCPTGGCSNVKLQCWQTDTFYYPVNATCGALSSSSSCAGNGSCKWTQNNSCVAKTDTAYSCREALKKLAKYNPRHLDDVQTTMTMAHKETNLSNALCPFNNSSTDGSGMHCPQWNPYRTQERWQSQAAMPAPYNNTTSYPTYASAIAAFNADFQKALMGYRMGSFLEYADGSPNGPYKAAYMVGRTPLPVDFNYTPGTTSMGGGDSSAYVALGMRYKYPSKAWWYGGDLPLDECDPAKVGTAGAKCTFYYTTNGSTPTTSSTVYTTPFRFSTAGTWTIKVLARNDLMLEDVTASKVVTCVNNSEPAKFGGGSYITCTVN